MFNSIKQAFTRLYTTITSPLQKLFTRSQIDEDTLKELERILLEADTGIVTSSMLIDKMRQAARKEGFKADDIKTTLARSLRELLAEQVCAPSLYDAPIVLLMGINGSGKTTCASKLAYRAQKAGKKVLLVAADTFRAAATEQLILWAQKLGVDIVVGDGKQDPATVVFRGCKKFSDEGYDQLIIDTAGRLQTHINLMKELEKIRRVIGKQVPQAKICSLLTIDGMLGQNSFEQAKLFHGNTPLDGIIITKMDGTGKGGIIFAIVATLHIPIAYISYGEQVDALMPFNAENYIDTILGDR